MLNPLKPRFPIKRKGTWQIPSIGSASIDAMIAAGTATDGEPLPLTKFMGQGITNTNAADQTKGLAFDPKTSAKFTILIRKGPSADDVTVKASPLTKGWSARYTYGHTAISSSVQGALGWSYSFPPNTENRIEVEILSPPDATPSEPQGVLVDVISAGIEDTVQATVVPNPVWQPNLAVRILSKYEPASLWIGKDTKNADGTDQVLKMPIAPTIANEYVLRLENENVIDSSFHVTLPMPPTGWKVQLLSDLQNGTDVTAQALTKTGWLTPLITGNDVLEMRFIVTADSTAAKIYEAKPMASHGNQVDVVNIKNGLQMVASLEMSVEEGWVPVPVGGIDVRQYRVLSLRALPSNPDFPWPIDPFFPVWFTSANRYPGREVHLHFSEPTPEGKKGEVVKATCGNSVSVEVRVAPYVPLPDEN